MEAFDAFFEQSYAGVVRSVALAIGQRDVAEECVQEAFARAYRRWRRVAALDRPAAWVHVVAVRVAIDRHRHLAHEGAGEADPADGPDSSDDVAADVDLRRALALLPPRQRQAVVLRYLGGLSIEEAAQAMRCAPGTVKSAVHAGLARMRVELTEVDPEPAASGRSGRGR